MKMKKLHDTTPSYTIPIEITLTLLTENHYYTD